MDEKMKWKLVYSQSSARKPFHQLSSRQQRKIKAEMRFRQQNIESSIGPEEPTIVHKRSESTKHCQITDASTAATPIEELVDHVVFEDDEISDQCLDEHSESDSIDSDEFSEQLEDKQSYRDKLARCFAEQNITHVQGNAILKVIRSHNCFASIPKDMRTLLRTPRAYISTMRMEPGEYLHAGFESNILTRLSGLSNTLIPPFLEIDISTDGGTLDRSGSNQIWPIQFRIVNIPDPIPQILGIYKGPRKPSSAKEFFDPFVQEVKQVMLNNGVEFRGRRIPIRFRCFIADAPARAFILNHRGHTAASPCSKCKVVGTYYQGRMVFLGIDHPLRSDDEYARRIDDEHHKEGGTPLSELGLDTPSRVPYEYMHLGCLGAMKKLIGAWVAGNYSQTVKLSARDIDLISRRLDILKEFCPREFARRPRTLRDYKRYKATELRQFLLYTGPVVLRGILHPHAYQHFLLLHAMFRVLIASSPSQDKLLFAEMAVKKWVERCSSLYGPAFVSYNIHGLTHLVADVKELGPLDSFSAFPFENNMPYFRKFIRKPNLPLQQFALRMAELSSSKSASTSSKNIGVHAAKRHNAGPVPLNFSEDIQQFEILRNDNFSLGLSSRDSCCMLFDSSICLLKNIILADGSYTLIVRRFQSVDILYDVGIPSTSVGVFQCSSLSTNNEVIKVVDVKQKCYRMPHFNNINGDDSDTSDDELDEPRVGYYVVMSMSS